MIRQQQSTKSSTKDVNHGTITETLSWCKFTPLSGICVNSTTQETENLLGKFQQPSKKPKVSHTYNLLDFGKYCEESSRVKESTSAILLQSGLMKDGGPILWNAIAICEMFKTSLLTDGKSQNERIFGESFKDMLRSRREFWEEHILIAEIEESEKLDASETYPRKVKDRILYFICGDSITNLCMFAQSAQIEKCSQVLAVFIRS